MCRMLFMTCVLLTCTRRLSPEDVEAETSDAFRRLYKLTKFFSGAAVRQGLLF